jgi:hypothetical protein
LLQVIITTALPGVCLADCFLLNSAVP